MRPSAIVTETREIRVRGVVQGVGFRPTVYRLAVACGLQGEVSNDTEGVLIRLRGDQDHIERFLRRLREEAPPLSSIASIESRPVTFHTQYHRFRIIDSQRTAGRGEIATDAAVCPACLAEIDDPAQRRHQYPFTNCAHCGPRLSIVEGIPYDRANTTMRDFPLCRDCAAEYADPLDRRFHAQPIACPTCGPAISLHGASVEPAASNAQALDRIHTALAAGRIVAVKGLGGFHLCCDARNHRAVQTLRERKRRYGKPFAVMCPDLDTIARYCKTGAAERDMLASPAAPIVLLWRRRVPKDGLAELSGAIAPGSRLLGMMLPYTPLHHLIARRMDAALVMTSGNLSGQPQIIDNAEAIEKLTGIADLVVCHNRAIANRIDDSVLRFVGGKARMIRRARGFAPKSIALPSGFEDSDGVVAYGAELKSTFCLVKQGRAILSQHQGDLENLETWEDYVHNLDLYQRLFELTPTLLCHDRHPEYLSTQLALQHERETSLPRIAVQHHHAHIVSALVEHGRPLTAPPVLGVALDGLGFGDDGGLWGGEWLLADYRGFKRLARLQPVVMPGGAQAVKQPWRNTYAHLINAMPWERFLDQWGHTPLAQMLTAKPLATLQAVMDKGLNSPLASSTGRLFDAVAGALLLHPDRVLFEGQAAIELEMLVDPNAFDAMRQPDAYPFPIEDGDATGQLRQLSPRALWPRLLDDLNAGVSKAEISARFHAGLALGLVELIARLHKTHAFDTVALSGGCLQNSLLLNALEQILSARGFNVIGNLMTPANDGGVALGQAAIAAARTLSECGAHPRCHPRSECHVPGHTGKNRRHRR